jgi:hypothetical protein
MQQTHGECYEQGQYQHHNCCHKQSFFEGETMLYAGQNWPQESRQKDRDCPRTLHHHSHVGLQTQHGYGWMVEGAKEFSSSDESMFEVGHGME